MEGMVMIVSLLLAGCIMAGHKIRHCLEVAFNHVNLRLATTVKFDVPERFLTRFLPMPAPQVILVFHVSDLLLAFSIFAATAAARVGGASFVAIIDNDRNDCNCCNYDHNREQYQSRQRAALSFIRCLFCVDRRPSD